MSLRKILLLVAAAAACQWPLVAAAQQDRGFTLEAAPTAKPEPIFTKEVEIGIGYASTDSFKFSEYTGLGETEVFGIGSLTIRFRSPYDSNRRTFWSIVGTDLGLDSRTVRVEYGQQGLFKIAFEFDQIPHFRLDDARSPFLGAGSKSQSLPAGWVGATTTPGMTALGASLNRVEVKTERLRFGGKLSWNFAKGWKVKASYRHEMKNGEETLSAIFGTTGGNMRSTFLIVPIDQKTDDFNVGVSYSGKMFQFALNYHLSLFTNNVDSVTWDNPYLNPGPWNPATDFAAGGRGRMGLPPDNSAHQISATAGVNVGETTRVVGSFAYGIMLQDTQFLPYTINPLLLAPIPLPRTNLDGRVDTLHGTLSISSRPLRPLYIRARYVFDDRNNKTPRDVYVVLPNDTADQPGATSSRARMNRPYSYTTHKLSLDARYRLWRWLRLSAGYVFNWRERDFQEVARTTEHTAKVKLRYRANSRISGWVGYDRSWRSGSSYVSNQPFLDGHSPDHLATLTFAQLFENDPLLRKYYFADRYRDAVKGAVTYIVTDQLNLSARGSYIVEDYHDTAIGITNRDRYSFAFDVSYNPTETLTFFGFASYDFGSHRQRGYQRTGGAFPPGAPRDPGRFWTLDTRDKVITAGVGTEWQPIKNKLKIVLEYTFSRGRTEIDPTPGTSLTAAPLPDLVTTIHAVSLSGEYKIRPQWVVKLGYGFRWFRAKDFALDGVDSLTLARVILLGNGTPNYRAHVVGLSLAYRW